MILTIHCFLHGSVPKLPFKGPNILLACAELGPAWHQEHTATKGTFAVVLSITAPKVSFIYPFRCQLVRARLIQIPTLLVIEIAVLKWSLGDSLIHNAAIT